MHFRQPACDTGALLLSYTTIFLQAASAVGLRIKQKRMPPELHRDSRFGIYIEMQIRDLHPAGGARTFPSQILIIGILNGHGRFRTCGLFRVGEALYS